MSTGSVQNTAQIIPFPIARRPVGDRHQQATFAELETQAAAIATSEAWYHDEAIEDAKLPVEH
jgi:hypothetical protein